MPLATDCEILLRLNHLKIHLHRATVRAQPIFGNISQRVPGSMPSSSQPFLRHKPIHGMQT